MVFKQQETKVRYQINLIFFVKCLNEKLDTAMCNSSHDFISESFPKYFIFRGRPLRGDSDAQAET